MIRRSSPQDISWFLDLRSNSQLNMDPPYQRRSVWNVKDRRFFLDTVFRGYPSPPIFLHKTLGPGERTIYAVVDGKQRLETLFLFADGRVSLAEDCGDDRLSGKTWPQIAQDEKKLFWDYVIPVEFLTFDEDDTRAVNQAFDRLNRNMRKLEPQELRHARWDGWFLRLVERECESDQWKTLGIVTAARSKRMKDAQFISELLLVVIEERQVGFSQDLLDSAYAKFDDVDGEEEESIEPDAVIARIEATKEYLLEMERTNASVRPAARSLQHFYTLWVLVALHRDLLPGAAEFASTYQDFMTKIGAQRDGGAVPEGDETSAIASEYLLGYGGASTDITPRTARLNALLKLARLR